MIPDRPEVPIIDRLRRAGAATATAPDVAAIRARATQRRRRRQISVTAASMVVVGGLGLGSARLLARPSDTEISAAGEFESFAPMAASAALPPAAVTSTTTADIPDTNWQTPSTTMATTTTANPAVSGPRQAAQRSELADGRGGTVLVDQGRLMHVDANGDVSLLELPPTQPTTQRQVNDLAMLHDRPFLLVSDFTDRPDLAAQELLTSTAKATDETPIGLMHQELAIYAVDLETDEVFIVEQRTITDRESADWVYNGHVTASGDHIMVVRELWQSMCVYVEGLGLDGTMVGTPENPLPEPDVDHLDRATIRSILAGDIDPPSGCIGVDELPDGVMSVLGRQADSGALDAVNAQLRSAASLTAAALSD